MDTTDGLDTIFARYVKRLERKGDVAQTIANNLVTFGFAPPTPTRFAKV